MGNIHLIFNTHRKLEKQDDGTYAVQIYFAILVVS